MEMMSLKKKLTAVKTGAASMVKKVLTLEKLFQLLSQEEHDTLLHMSDKEEKADEKISEERIDENEMKENNKDKELEFQTDKLLTLLTYLFMYKVVKD
ncbi:uncharacterized protein BDCG_17254 [Blastomyces dermatitidis ER-3]|uniref:Uncharacterized protein n=1 Tax=Ajellomyces dermatitidis (strain ER-3 / ATCC MYA-2586) TaxID=559297 RepID=A0ABX2VXQ0_AJEDR|nr:uncharacterized protein BDCG_17254 [Blastomyces dermatitidis ER-3]OAT01846.1 hypothetical protein BDCG_17254 [Blastomyces dermatitidis ER-3]